MSILDLGIVIAYPVLMLLTLLFVRSAKSEREFAIGSQVFPSSITFATLAATCVGPGFVVGLAGNVANQGFIWVLIFSFFSLQMVISGLFLAPKLRQIKGVFTVGGVMGRYYGKGAQFATGIITILFCAGVVGAIARVTGTFAETLLGLNANLAIVISMAIVVGYSTIGGIKAIVLTDIIQFIILAAFIPSIIFFESQRISFENISASFTFNPSDMGTMTIVGLVASFFFGELLLPPYAQRALMTKSQTVAKKSFMMVGFFSAIWFIVVGSIGAVGKLLFPEVAGDAIFVTVMQNSLPVGILGLVTAGIISIIASSQDSFINSAAISFTEDVIQLKGKKKLMVTKAFCVVVGIMATTFALYIPSIIDGLLIVYSLWAPAIVAPLVFALVFKKVSPFAGLMSTLAGISTVLIWEFLLKNPFELSGLLPGIVVSGAVALIINALINNAGSGIFKPLQSEVQ